MKFGIKKYEVVDDRFYHDSHTGNPVRKILKVEFANGRTYRSYYDKRPVTMLYSILYGDQCPASEKDVEFLAVEALCCSLLGNRHEST